MAASVGGGRRQVRKQAEELPEPTGFEVKTLRSEGGDLPVPGPKEGQARTLSEVWWDNSLHHPHPPIFEDL